MSKKRNPKIPNELPETSLVSLGSRLREARSGAGLTVQQLHEKTRVPVEAISALEEERHHDLPATVYTRGFVKLLCGELRLPYDEIVALLPASSPVPSMAALSLLDVPTTAREADKEEDKQSRVSTALVLFILVVLASLAISYFASQKERESLQTPSASEAPHLDVTG